MNEVGVCHFDHIHSEEWQEVRKKVLERDDSSCVVCGHKSKHNCIHHENYKRLGLIGEEEDCITLCRRHHEGIHNTLNYFAERRGKCD